MGTAPLTIDLSPVTHLGSGGVAVLRMVLHRAQRRGIDVELIAPPGGTAHHVLTLAGLPIAPHRDETDPD
jgi:ABC-type transporter Mla MlaB component